MYQLQIFIDGQSDELIDFADAKDLLRHVLSCEGCSPLEAILDSGIWTGWKRPAMENSPEVNMFALYNGKLLLPLDLSMRIIPSI